MPQMSPMLWFFIYIYILLNFMLMLVMMNYMINLYKLIIPIIKTLNKISYKWYW